MRKRWQTLVPAIGRTSIETASFALDAPPRGAAAARRGATASSGSKTAGSSSYSTSTSLRRRARRRAGRRGDGGDDVAGVAGDVGEHALVLDLAAVAAEVGDVVAASSTTHVGRPARRSTSTRACGCGERTNAACSMPGRSTSTE